MKTPISNSDEVAAEEKAAADYRYLLTVAGAVPPELTNYCLRVPPPHLPETCRLPRPGEKDPIANGSRTWLIDTDAYLPPAEKFLFRVRQPGKIRGAVFINVAKLLAFLKKAEAADREGGAK